MEKAIANYNMGFNNGCFKRGKEYKYRKNPKPNVNAEILVTTEEGTEQEFWYKEFDMLFTLLKN